MDERTKFVLQSGGFSKRLEYPQVRIKYLMYISIKVSKKSKSKHKIRDSSTISYRELYHTSLGNQYSRGTLVLQ